MSTRKFAIVDLKLEPPSVVSIEEIERSDTLHDGPDMMSVPIQSKSPVAIGWVWDETRLYDPANPDG